MNWLVRGRVDRTGFKYTQDRSDVAHHQGGQAHDDGDHCSAVDSLLGIMAISSL